MALWKKVAIGLGVLLLGTVGAIAVFIYFFPPFGDMCGNQVLKEYPSPSGKLKAVVFERDCGATTGFSTQVSIIQAGNALENEGANLFSTDTNRGRAPSGLGGGPEVRFRWLTDSSAELQHHPLVRIYRAETKVRGVQVVISAFADR
jgi:hypothetical protein